MLQKKKNLYFRFVEVVWINEVIKTILDLFIFLLLLQEDSIHTKTVNQKQTNKTKISKQKNKGIVFLHMQKLRR